MRVHGSWKTVPDSWEHLTEEQLDALEVGAVRAFQVGRIRLSLRKQERGTWEVDARAGVTSERLGEYTSAPRVRRGESAGE